MSDDVLVQVFVRNSFYRRQYLLALSVFALALVVIGVLSCVLLYLIKNPSRPLYFATDTVGRLIKVVPINQPNMTNDEVGQWVTRAVEDAYSYDYVNYRSQLQSSQNYFTDFGWKQYMSALQLANNLPAVTERKLIVLADVVSPPKLVAVGVLKSGAYAWKFEMPVLITFWYPPYDDKSKVPNPWTVSVIVERQPILQSTDGLGIIQLIARFATTDNSAPQQIANTPSG